MGELQDSLEIWRELLAKDNSPEERIQLELLLANGLLQGGKRKEAATAFRSLADSENPEARVQGLLGLAEVANAADERQRARTLYRQIADRYTESVWRVRALQELADMATEDGRGEESLAIRRELLASLPPSHPAAPEARLALIGALVAAGSNEEAVRVCQQAIGAAPSPDAARSAKVACAEADERSGRWDEAWTAYSEVLYDPGTPADVVVDAALGASRAAWQSSGAVDAAQILEVGLSRTESPTDRLPLLSARIQMLRSLGDTAALREAEAERNTLADQAPNIAWAAYLESAGQARSQGDPSSAVALLSKAMDLPLSTEQRARVLVELGAAQLDAGDLEAASNRFTQAADLGSDDALITFHAGMGRAEILRRGGSPADAAALLETLTAPDQEEQYALLQARGQALTEAGDPSAEDIWRTLAQSAEADLSTRFTALRGRADALRAQDQPVDALPLYQEAERIAREPWEQGWAALGIAETQAELGDREAAVSALDTLREHSDPEVRMQACIRRSQLAAIEEDWDTALTVLPSSDTDTMGAAWDASATSARASALMGAGDPDGAEAAYRALAKRWPDNEEGYLPAWLGLAQLAQTSGDDAEAHRWARKAFRTASDPGYRRQARDMVRDLAN
jgi:tetratricopeptide (TPR) repeat protein